MPIIPLTHSTHRAVPEPKLLTFLIYPIDPSQRRTAGTARRVPSMGGWLGQRAAGAVVVGAALPRELGANDGSCRRKQAPTAQVRCW